MRRQSEKRLLNSNIFSRCSRNMANFGPLTAEMCWQIWGTPANFNGFRVLASLLQRRRSPEANQALHDLWPSPGLVHYIYIFVFFAPDGILPRAKVTFRPNLVFSYCHRYCMALQQRISAKLCAVVQGMELRNFRKGCHLYSAGRPSRWASAQILVSIFFRCESK